MSAVREDRPARPSGRRRIALTCLCAAVVATSFAACGDSDEGGGAQGEGSKKAVSIGIAETFTSIPYYQIVAHGAEAAAAEDGQAKVKVVGPPQATGSAEATMAQNLQQADQPDGIGPNPCILPAWQTTLASLVRSVPDGNVAAWGCPPVGTPEQSSPVKTFVGASSFARGYQTADAVVKEGKLSASTTGTALVATCAKGVPELDNGQAGLAAGIEKLLPQVKVVQFASALDQSPNTAAWASQFGQHSDVVFAAGPCDQDATSLALLKKRGEGGKFLAGVVNPNDAQAFGQIESGLLTAGVSQGAWIQGYVVTRLLIDGARGEALPEGWVDTGLYTVTKANAAEWKAASASPEAEAKFFAPMAARVLEEAATNPKPIGDSVRRSAPEGT
jgi:ribose transport system substrate-binding protein